MMERPQLQKSPFPNYYQILVTLFYTYVEQVTTCVYFKYLLISHVFPTQLVPPPIQDRKLLHERWHPLRGSLS